MIDIPTRVKDALREGDRLKRYRFIVDDDPVITIDNDHLVSESVFFDERMCSDKEIKFGLCEGTSLEFQYFGLPNITGKRLQAFIDVQYKDADGELKWHEIPMGWFEVSESSRQASTGIIKVSAFNKLQSDYLDAKANDEIIETVKEGESGVANSATIDTILMELLYGYTIEPKFVDAEYTLPQSFSSVSGGYTFTYTSFNMNLVVPEGNIRIDISHFNDNGAYRLVINRLAMRELLLEEMGEYANVEVKNSNNLEDGFYPLYQCTFYEYGTSPANMHPVTYPLMDILMIDGRAEAKVYGAGADDIYTSDFVIKKYTQNTVFIQFPIAYVQIPRGTTRDAHDVWWELSVSERERIQQKWLNFFNDKNNFRIEERDSNEFGSLDISISTAEALPDVTLRELQSSVYELSCQYGRLDRTTDLFSGIELNNSRLLPAEDLYPANDLYPASQAERSNPAMYSKLWADEGNVRKFRYLIITYKGTETEGGQTREVEKTLQRTVNADGTDDYNMSDNWLFKNLVWTDEQVGDYADAMVAKMQDVTWFPFEMWCAGLPYVEAGDELEINVNGEAYTSYVLRRSLKGIQNLQDEMINGELDIF